MQDRLMAPLAAPRSRSARAAVASGTPSFVQVLQATFGVFAHHPLHVTFWAVFCFAGAGVIGSLLYAGMIADAVARTGTHSGVTVMAYNTQMLAQAVIGAFAWQIGRGAITWLAMQPPNVPVTLRATLHAVLRNGWPLVVSALLYGTLITLGLLGLTMLLRELRLDISNARWSRGSMDGVMHWTTVRALAAVPPDPGSPFSDWLSAARYNLARSPGNPAYFGFDLNAYVTRSASPQGVLVGLAAIALLFVTDAALCLRTAAIFGPRGGSSWLRTTLEVSSAHFWRVAGWRWTIRLTIAAVVIAALILPPALHQAVLMAEVRRAISAGGYWPYHIAQSAYGIGIALVSSFLVAFSLAFEARMFVALGARPEATRR
jgi:hypothetical protein